MIGLLNHKLACLTLSIVALALLLSSCAHQQTASVESATFKSAFVQLNGRNAGNYPTMSSYVAEAKSKGAEIVIFPESSAFGWLNPEVFQQAHPIPGASQQAFSKMAVDHDIWIVTGLAEQGPAIPDGSGDHFAFDSGILINPQGEVVIHHRKYQVLNNAFTPSKCPAYFQGKGCQYNVGSLSDIEVVDTPFGKTSLIVCADAYTYNQDVLNILKQKEPALVIVPWGVGASQQAQCGQAGFNATEYAAQAAKIIESAYVIGANATGVRPYGRLRPAVYCGNSGYANPDGTVGGVANSTQAIVYFDIPRG